MSKILIVDDDIAIARLISDALEDEGFETDVACDGESAMAYILENSADISLITLDIMMPGMSGIDLCKTVREKVDCPIIFVSAKSKTIDAVLGLEIGDDYISKPFVVEEFVARVKAHLRREQRNAPNPFKDIIRVGDIEINKASYEVRKNGAVIPFSTREFQLLQYLMENAGMVLTREQIFAHVWDTEFGDIGTVAVNIKGIRDKIDPSNEYIKTVWGVGYKFVKVYK
ncbi:MAG: response regulator transcription factor [Clostridia bacterium]|nr:response regulator transcription factor [Clostridia bacterium]MBO7319879.1 response regulator transcription factor [Clostridia bacterium]